ncbi:hypothetical protein GCM10027405_13950 [Arthrobacter alkaliphilus]|uniref:hypothetical protein n=1 Tax=Arthrobacter alkaliphilus TaxID=369936 RepID=UPI001F41D013|nr:hypothetical protein [Arthrobacter alkaliphilus]
MDAIKSLISATDPLKAGPLEVPDSETVLQQIVMDRSEPVDKMPPNVRSLADARRQRAARIAGLLTIAAAAVTAVVLVAPNPVWLTGAPVPANSGQMTPLPSVQTSIPATPTATPTATTPQSPTASATASASPAVTDEPSASAPPAADPGWTSYVNASAHVQFDLPAGWTATDVPPGTVDYPDSGIKVADEQGKVMAKFYHVRASGVGGLCGPGTFKQTELDSAASSLTGQWVTNSQVRFSYRVLDQTAQGGGISYQIGLVDKIFGRVADSCMMYTRVSDPKGTLSFATTDYQTIHSPTFNTMDEAVQYMQTAEYQKIKRMITSLQLTQ